ncbi:unnamed protein product [Calypogeia fissa]
MEPMWRFALILLLVVSLCPHRTHAQCFPAIFYLGDNDGDTGGIHASFPNTTAAESPPYGETYFGKPQGRNSDGRLIIDFIAGAFGLPFLDPYLQSVSSDFSGGVTFATWGATARTISYVSDFPLVTQIAQFQLFQKEVLAILNTTSSLLASRNLLANANNEVQQSQPGIHPYKKLYNDLFIDTNTTVDPILQRALAVAQRIPMASAFSQGLYMMSIGTNDFKAGILAAQTPAQILLYLPTVVTFITNAVNSLYNSGARNIIVSGVGNIGCSPSLLAVIPYTLADLDNWGCLTAYNTIARNYNTLLKAGLANVTLFTPGANIIYLDNYQMQHNLLFNYTMNGMVESINACCGVPSTTYNYDPEVLCGEEGNIANVLTVLPHARTLHLM